MDRNTVTGILLIVLVMAAWAYFSMPSQEELAKRKAKQARQDSLVAAQADSQKKAKKSVSAEKPQTGQDSSATKTLQQDEGEESAGAMGIFGKASQSDTTFITVKTPLYKSKFTNVGAGPATFTLLENLKGTKKFTTWDDKPLQLIKDTTKSAYVSGFLTNQNFNVETDNLVFKQLTRKKSISLQKGDSAQIKYALQIAPKKKIIYTYTLYGHSYEINLDVKYVGLNRNIIGSKVDFGWKPRLNLTEKDKSQEATMESAYAYSGEELERLHLDESGSKEKNYSGSVAWVSTRTKFFTQIIRAGTPTESGRLVGRVTDDANQDVPDHHYQSYLSSNIPDNGIVHYKLFVGPLDYHSLSNFDETTFNMVNVGYSWTRWFSGPLVKYIIIPFFDFMSPYMNLGLAIVLFGILVKMILYPLTKKSYRSMAAMKELQPKMQELKEKYEDDPQKQQQATMKLYKQEGVNPVGGCLPNLLQLPILVTLYRFIQHSILMRGEPFLWAKDLSTPDYIIHLPFHIPIIGDKIAGFVLLMTAVMLVQSKVTGGMGGPGGGMGGSGGPNMSALKYIFPFMLLFIFNNFAAGLSLYYLVYNIVSVGQQLIIYRQIDKEKELAEA